MKTIPRQLLLLAVTWTFVYSLCLYLFTGHVNAFITGAYASIAVVYGDRLFSGWASLTRTRRVIGVLGVAISLVAMAYAISKGVEMARNNAMRSSDLAQRIHANPNFQHVEPVYSEALGSILTLKGRVATEADLAALQDMSKENYWFFKTEVRWQVTVGSD